MHRHPQLQHLLQHVMRKNCCPNRPKVTLLGSQWGSTVEKWIKKRIMQHFKQRITLTQLFLLMHNMKHALGYDLRMFKMWTQSSHTTFVYCTK